MDATCKEEDVLPAGVLYFNLIDPIIKSSKNMSEEDIENEIRKKFKIWIIKSWWLISMNN